MPTRTRSASTRAHSCCSVYFTSLGNSIFGPSLLLRLGPGWVHRPLESRSSAPDERVGCGGDLLKRPFPDVVGRRLTPPSLPLRDPRLQELPHPVAASRAVSQPRRPGSDPAVPALRALPQVLSPRQLPPFRPRTALDLHDVQGEVHDRGVADRRPHPVGVHVPVQLEDAPLVDAAGGEDPDVSEAALVELPPDLAEDRAEVAPPAGGGVQP